MDSLNPKRIKVSSSSLGGGEKKRVGKKWAHAYPVGRDIDSKRGAPARSNPAQIGDRIKGVEGRHHMYSKRIIAIKN